jgi:hypothetical protein
MTGSLRPILAIFFALTLALTGQAMAVARGASGPTGELILCTGAGAVAVQVDENGQPVGPVHICPDCALSLFDVGAVSAVGLPRPVTRAESVRVLTGPVLTPAEVIPAAARGPPVFI